MTSWTWGLGGWKEEIRAGRGGSERSFQDRKALCLTCIQKGLQVEGLDEWLRLKGESRAPRVSRTGT